MPEYIISNHNGENRKYNPYALQVAACCRWQSSAWPGTWFRAPPFLPLQLAVPLASFTWLCNFTITQICNIDDQTNENLRKHLVAHWRRVGEESKPMKLTEEFKFMYFTISDKFHKPWFADFKGRNVAGKLYTLLITMCKSKLHRIRRKWRWYF